MELYQDRFKIQYLGAVHINGEKEAFRKSKKANHGTCDEVTTHSVNFLKMKDFSILQAVYPNETTGSAKFMGKENNRRIH